MPEKGRVVFLMPRHGAKPIGGFKVTYDYANRLMADGHEVLFIYPAYIPRLNANKTTEFLRRIKSAVQFLKKSSTRGYSCRSWFPLDLQIKEKYVWDLTQFKPVKGDIIVATAATTAPLVSRLEGDNIRKFYFIQHFEAWSGATDEDVYATYRLDLSPITISRWLQQKVAKVGRQAHFVPNGFDLNRFRILVTPEQRNPMRILTLYHEDEWKGSREAIEAFRKCRERFPELQLVLFGAVRPPEDVVREFEFHYKCKGQELVDLYNSASVFIGSSRKEGWGLTVGEAMLCGCAVACTDNEGYLEMAIDGQNALVSPVGDVKRLAEKISRLVSDADLRISLAHRGCDDMKRFEIGESYKAFKKALGV